MLQLQGKTFHKQLISRKIKYIFSGDLEKRVRTYPKFKG